MLNSDDLFQNRHVPFIIRRTEYTVFSILQSRILLIKHGYLYETLYGQSFQTVLNSQFFSNKTVTSTKLGPPFGAITSAMGLLLRRLSTRFCYAVTGIDFHSSLKNLQQVESRSLASCSHSQSAFQLIRKMFNGIKIGPLDRPIQFFNSQSHQTSPGMKEKGKGLTDQCEVGGIELQNKPMFCCTLSHSPPHPVIIIIRVFCPKAVLHCTLRNQGCSSTQRQISHCKFRNPGCSFTRDGQVQLLPVLFCIPLSLSHLN